MDLSYTLDNWSDVLNLRTRPRWLLSQDNSTAHTSADLVGLRIWPADRILSLPALSPDMHKVVEHVHAWLTQQMTDWRYAEWPRRPSLEECKSKLVELFFSYKAGSIQADVNSLPATYQAIIDSDGMYAPPPLR